MCWLLHHQVINPLKPVEDVQYEIDICVNSKSIPETMNPSRLYLIFSAAGLLPIALSYGIAPNRILPKLLKIQPMGGDLVHILRAVMGLYLAILALWLLGAIRGGSLMRTAIISEIVFMSGLAAGRLLDMLLNGWPSPILIVYTLAELVLASLGILCLFSHDRNSEATVGLT